MTEGDSTYSVVNILFTRWLYRFECRYYESIDTSVWIETFETKEAAKERTAAWMVEAARAEVAAEVGSNPKSPPRGDFWQLL